MNILKFIIETLPKLSFSHLLYIKKSVDKDKIKISSLSYEELKTLILAIIKEV